MLAALHNPAPGFGTSPKILVTGGHGQLGSELVELFVSNGIPHAAPGHSELDVTDSRAVEAQLDAGSFDTVIHTAAYTKVDLAESEPGGAYIVNADATRNLAELCGARDLRLVYLSTDFAFSGDKNVPYEAGDPTNPLNVYGASKVAGERAVMERCQRYFIIRTAWLFGTHGQNFPRTMLRAAADGRTLRVVDDQVGSPTYARDLAEIILRLLGIPTAAEGLLPTAATTHDATAPYGVYHATNAGHCSWHTLAVEVLRQAGWNVNVEPISSEGLPRPARRPAYSVLSLESIHAQGLYPRSWKQSLSAFLERLRLKEPDLFPR